MRIQGSGFSQRSIESLGGPSIDQSQQIDRTDLRRVQDGTAVAGSSDRVSISELAYRLRTLNLEESHWVKHLSRLEADIRAGRYQVDANALAERLISEALTGLP